MGEDTPKTSFHRFVLLESNMMKLKIAVLEGYNVELAILITKLNLQPILAKKIYDIYKFQIFKKITIFHNILNIKGRLCLDCIRHFQRATSQGYIIWDIGN